MTHEINRRNFVAKSVIASAGAALAAGVAASEATAENKSDASADTTKPDAMPMGKIGDLRISRLLLGGNLLTHYTHSRDLKYVYSLAKHYNTDAKILETLAIAEQNGVNTLVVHNVPHTIGLLQQYRKQGGKMQWITCTFHALVGGLARFSRQVDELVDAGTDAIYISGVEADTLCGYRNAMASPDAAERTTPAKMDLLAEAVDTAKAHGLPTGLGAHRLGAIQDCEKAGLDVDFYLKTFHHHKYPSANIHFDSSFCPQPEAVADFMKTVKKPWFAYKVMAAGAIPPANAFRHAFQNGADFVLAGMFDFEIEQDARLVREIVPSVHRTRPVCA